MKNPCINPALIAHGGAGGRAPEAERESRRKGMLAAVEAGARILNEGGSALDAVVATIVILEDHPLFNAGYGSALTSEGRVEMDAAVACADAVRGDGPARFVLRAGGVVMLRRVRNPILLARAVMERTPHLLMGGAGAERIAPLAELRFCRPETLITTRARERWVSARKGRFAEPWPDQHGTVGAAAVDAHGNLAAATSTGGVAGKLPGRIGDSAILGAGLLAEATGAASATGIGEAILKTALCREVVSALRRHPAEEAAAKAILRLQAEVGGEAGIVVVDAKGRFGAAHNAAAMEIATFTAATGVTHALIVPLTSRS